MFKELPIAKSLFFHRPDFASKAKIFFKFRPLASIKVWDLLKILILPLSLFFSMIRKIYLIFYDFFDAKETNGNIDVILKNYNSFMKKKSKQKD